jgi:hypothetical protein
MTKKYTKRENEIIKYEINPSVANLLLSDKPRKKFIREKTLTDEKVAAVVGVGVNDDFGELVKGSMFISSKKVDSETFVKVYAEGWRVLLDLSGTALKVFKFIYKQVLDNPKKDSIVLHYTSLKARNLIEMSQPTFKSGLNELLNKNCLFSSYEPNIYFLNVQYFFNGERHYLIQEYQLVKKITNKELEQPELGDYNNEDE